MTAMTPHPSLISSSMRANNVSSVSLYRIKDGRLTRRNTIHNFTSNTDPFVELFTMPRRRQTSIQSTKSQEAGGAHNI
jgi:hypothetical protein